MEDYSELFNSLTDEQKRDKFVEVYNLMIKYKRNCGWILYVENRFLFFDSKPSYDDAFFVALDELLEWIEELK